MLRAPPEPNYSIFITSFATSYLDLLNGLDVDAAALAVLHDRRVEGVHQDDSSQAGSLLPLHVLQEHPSFLHLVADDGGDVGCNEKTSTQEPTHPCVNISKIRNKKRRGTKQTWSGSSVEISDFFQRK